MPLASRNTTGTRTAPSQARNRLVPGQIHCRYQLRRQKRPKRQGYLALGPMAPVGPALLKLLGVYTGLRGKRVGAKCRPTGPTGTKVHLLGFLGILAVHCLVPCLADWAFGRGGVYSAHP